MKKIFFLGVSLFFLTTLSIAQDRVGYLSTRIQTLNFSNFNQQITDLNFAEMPTYVVESGVGGMFYNGRWMVRIVLAAGSAENDIENTGDAFSRFRYGGFQLGNAFNILEPTSNWFLGPEVVWTSSLQQIHLAETAVSNNLISAAEINAMTLGRAANNLNVGLNFQRFLPNDEAGNNSGGILLGVQAGYQLDNEMDEWRLNQAVAIENNGILTSGWFGGFTFDLVLN